MKSIIKFSVLLFLISACASKKTKILGTTTNPTEKSSDYNSYIKLNEHSKNKKYGLSGKYPVKVGDMSVQNQRKFLASLAGPNGEELEFHRRGSCCAYKSKNAVFGGSALVDVYEVKYEGLSEPILIYISFYDSEKLYIPLGFTKRK